MKNLIPFLLLAIVSSVTFASSYPIPAPGTSGNLMKSNGTKWTSASATSSYTAPTKSLATVSSHSGGMSANGSGTYTTPANVLYIRVTAVGGGGGGGGSGSTTGNVGAKGDDTTFGTSLITAGGAVAMAGPVTGGVGGTATATGLVGIVIDGGQGSGNSTTNVANVNFLEGAPGASSALGGAGGGGNGNVTGYSATANSGSGGGGGGIAPSLNAQVGGGGGAGAYVQVIINSPSATYGYAVGGGGSPGAAGTSGNAGGYGGGGLILVEEFYQ